MPEFYGEIKGTVLIEGDPVVRDIVAISYSPIDTGVLDENGDPILARQVVGATTSGVDGTYTLQALDFDGEAIVVALDTYGDEWKPNRSYSVGDIVRPSIGNETGYVYECTLDGVSDPTEPEWWIDDGGDNEGQVGSATFIAIPSWYPVAHAPIVPVRVDLGTILYPLELDPFYEDTFFLWHCDGDDNAQTFENNGTSGNAYTITPNQVVTRTGYAGSTGSAALYCPAGQFVLIDDHPDFDFMRGEFTVEFRFKAESFGLGNWARLFYVGGGVISFGSGFNQIHFGIQVSDTGKLYVSMSDGSSAYNVEGGVLSTGNWYDIAVTVDASETCRGYINGLKVMEFDVSGRWFHETPKTDLGINVIPGQAGTYSGEVYYDEIRITKGEARYTADNYTPATVDEPFADSRFAVGREPTIIDPYFPDTVSILHFEDTDTPQLFTDVMGLSWDAQNQAQNSPLEKEYGDGALRLDGTADAILQGALGEWNFLHDGTADYTIEVSVWRDNASNDNIFDSGGGPSAMRGVYCTVLSNGACNFGIAGGYGNGNYVMTAVGNAGDVPIQAWTKIAIVVEGGVGCRVYVNGVETSVGLLQRAHSTSNHSQIFRFGHYTPVGGYDFGGYMDEIRITRAARYSGNYTPAIAAFPDFEYDPFENLANAPIYPVVSDPYFDDNVVLLHFDGDNTDTDTADVMGHVVTIGGGGRISTAQSRFGGSSFESADPGGRVSISVDDLIAAGFGQGDFTLEVSFYLPSSGVAPSDRIFQLRDGDIQSGIYMAMTDSVNMQFGLKTAGSGWTLSPAYTMTSGAWNYLVLERYNGTVTASVNAVAQWSTVFNSDIELVAGESAVIGGQSSGRSSGGFFDEFRLTNAARYKTEAPDIPVEAFPSSRFAPGREPTIVDAYFPDTVTLYHFEEVDADSIENKAEPEIAVNLDLFNLPLLSGDTKKFGDKSLRFISGSHAELRTNFSSGSAWTDLGARDVTFEGFFFFNTSEGPLFQQGASGAGSSSGSDVTKRNGVSLRVATNGQVDVYAGNLGSFGWGGYMHIKTASGAIPQNTWSHIAFVITDQVPKLYVNGVNVPFVPGNGSTSQYDFTNIPLWTPVPFSLNADYYDNGVGMTGIQSGYATARNNVEYLDEFRFTNAARYDGDFTVPTEAYPDFEYDPFEDLTPPDATYPVEIDPFFDGVDSLLHFDGDDLSSNFTDEAGVVWTPIGGAALDTGEKVFGQSSLFLDGSSQYIKGGVSGDWDYLHDGTTDYTIEFFYRRLSATAQYAYMTGTGGTAVRGVFSRFNADGSIDFRISKGTQGTYELDMVAPAATAKVLEWQHYALVFKGAVATLYIDGVAEVTGAVLGSPSSANSEYELSIGVKRGTGQYFHGNIDEFRVSRVARYDADFTVPVEAYPSSRFAPGLAPTILDPYWSDVRAVLTFETGALVDGKGNTWTEGGDPVYVSDNGNHGGTMALNGTDQYIEIDHDAIIPAGELTESFTSELWVNLAGLPSGDVILMGTRSLGTPRGWSLRLQSNGALRLLGWNNSGTLRVDQTSAATVTVGQWVHIAVTHDGEDWRSWIDGAQATTETLTTNLVYIADDTQFRIGKNSDASGFFSGLIGAARYTAALRYSGTFTPGELFGLDYDPLENLELLRDWTPEDMSPELWLDPSDPSKVTDGGVGVTDLVDKSAQAIALEQDTASQMPQVDPNGPNGESVLFFDGGDVLEHTPNTDLGRNTQKIVATSAVKVDAFNSAFLFYIASSAGATAARFLVRAKTGDLWEIFTRPTASSTTYSITADGSGDIGEWVVISAIADYSTGEAIIRINGEEIVRSATLPVTTIQDAASTHFCIGANSSGAFQLTGNMSEWVLAYDEENLEKIEGYIAWKYGLESKLPAGHLYQYAPPRVAE